MRIPESLGDKDLFVTSSAPHQSLIDPERVFALSKNFIYNSQTADKVCHSHSIRSLLVLTHLLVKTQTDLQMALQQIDFLYINQVSNSLCWTWVEQFSTSNILNHFAKKKKKLSAQGSILYTLCVTAHYTN